MPAFQRQSTISGIPAWQIRENFIPTPTPPQELFTKGWDQRIPKKPFEEMTPKEQERTCKVLEGRYDKYIDLLFSDMAFYGESHPFRPSHDW